MTDYEAKAREIINRWLYLNKDRSLMVESAIATALQEAADEALERAIGAAEEYGIWNADNDYDLGRSETAAAILEDIRALKSPKGEE